MQDLSNSLEAALRYRVMEANEEHDLNVYTGQGDFDKEHPSLVVYCEDGNEEPKDSGNFRVSVQCELRGSSENQEISDWRNLCRDIFAILMADDLPQKLSEEASDLYVFGISNRTMRTSTDENQWLSVLSFDAYACLTDVG